MQQCKMRLMWCYTHVAIFCTTQFSWHYTITGKQHHRKQQCCLLFSVIPLRFSLTWVTTYKDSCWNGTPIVGMAGLWLARPFLDVAMDQLPSPWSLGAPTGKDICQRESWQLYFLFHLGLSLIHPSCSFLPFFSVFFLFSSQLKPTLLLPSFSFCP